MVLEFIAMEGAAKIPSLFLSVITNLSTTKTTRISVNIPIIILLSLFPVFFRMEADSATLLVRFNPVGVNSKIQVSNKYIGKPIKSR